MQSALQILQKYWGHSNFRKKQDKIINSILENKDTLAILPTGGGKSICYQIPALMMDGICIVVSPLISLMNDQVEKIKKKGIKAIALTSEMNYREIDIALTNCIFGNFKFLYLSPERLQNELVKKKISEMKINLIAIDESHCISEWGHNFRPSYRNISEIRKIKPKAPILALTATATATVVKDIQNNLNFKARNVIKSSFTRKNISYLVYKEENKNKKLLNILNKVKGSAIIYTKSRNDCEKLNKLLIKNNISSNYYHGGMSISERNKRQFSWNNSETKVMVATNAFGMGIDKSNVRLVIHFHIPYNVESYYQEIGRAGRDEKESYAILLYNNIDVNQLEGFVELNYPKISDIKDVYQKLANYFHLAVNCGEEESFDFNISEFCNKYKYNYIKVYNSLKYLEKEEYLKLIEIQNKFSRVKIKMELSELYKFQSNNSFLSPYIKLLLRSYSGLFDDFIMIDENVLSARSKTTEKKITEILYRLDKLEVISYISKKQGSKITYLQNRIENKHLQISEKKLIKRKESEIERMKYILNYTTQNSVCRNKILLSYFDEVQENNCGKCDICRTKD
ncbi:MAG: recombinase RecQ [Flavobacteriales bacterium]|nr:recombinase RecQ [Flavobacteriales bacterium]